MVTDLGYRPVGPIAARVNVQSVIYKSASSIALTTLALSACATSQPPTRTAVGAQAESSARLLLPADVEWEHLNPARGDKSPLAGTLWGDREGSGATGFLLRPVDGFESPPHIHNVSYRGVVIRGVIHYDDPNAEARWMPAGSFWTQPRGGVHITAARGSDTLANIEIDEGPYLVRPVEDAFETPETPINMDASSVAWEEASAGGSGAGPQVAFLWGDVRAHGPGGVFVKLRAGSAGTLRGHGSAFRAVVIQGRPEHGLAGSDGASLMEPGSLLSSGGGQDHQLTCGPAGDCILYVRTEGRFEAAATLCTRPPRG